ncbi:MAG: hypothetical protein DI592_23810, partial [Stenotrophomonas maltophilia]
QYQRPDELEDMSDIQPKSVLMLNVEPLDQIKEHVDFSISALSRELHELKAMIRDNAAREATRPAPVAPSPSRAGGWALPLPA